MQRVAGKIALMLLWMLGAPTLLVAQQPNVHFWHQGNLPPGAIGSRQLERGGPLPGFYQPVEIKTPNGALVSLAIQGRFEEAQSGRKVGLLIGSVYRLRITGIPFAEGQEVFPTIELVDRTYAPVGQELKFPIKIELTDADLKLALEGKFVTRVVYIEDPHNALPVGVAGQGQNWFDIRPGEDPLAMADVLGRPVAIIRIGGRLPTSTEDIDQSFLFGCPPFLSFPNEPAKTQSTPASSVTKTKRGNPNVKLLPPPPTQSDSVKTVSATENTDIDIDQPSNNAPIERIDIDQQPPLAQGNYAPWTPPGIRQPWPEDEYLRDGGTQLAGVAVDANRQVHGLQMEDTVVHYDMPDGQTIVEPSNEVYIYSPRFCSVRQVVGLISTQQRDKVSDVNVNLALANPSLTQKVGSAKQQVQVENKINARPALAFRMKQGDGAMSSVIGPRGFQDGFKPYENLTIIRQGMYENLEKMLLVRSAQSAITWSHDQAVQVLLERRGAMVATKDEQVGTIYTVDEEPGKPKLRVIKLASTPSAQPGEEVWFTIRFDNIGNKQISNVTIIDSLTTRLEFVEGSAQCSHDAKFSTQPNEGDSLVIRCELTKPVDPGKGGLIRFCCKVR